MSDQPITLDDLDPENPKIFGRVIDGVIVEYPVFDYHIVNREDSFDQYTPAIVQKKPEIPAYFYVYQIPTLSENGDKIIVRYSDPVPYNVDALFSSIPNNTQPHHVPASFSLPGETEDAVPLEVSDELRHLIFQAVKERVQQRLDQFAQTRDYFNMLSAVSYENSTVAKHHEEAVCCKQLRDATWEALYKLQDDIATGALPFPHNWFEVEQSLPLLQWPETHTEVSE